MASSRTLAGYNSKESIPDSSVPFADRRPGPGQEEGGTRFSKTQMCKFEIVGLCSKGSQCQFAHNATELMALPDLSCTKLCKTMVDTGMCLNKDCTFAHGKNELRATSTYHKTKICRFFSELGHCALGFKCNFAHSVLEVRSPSASMARSAQASTVSPRQLSSAPSSPLGTILPRYVTAPPQVPVSLPDPRNWCRDDVASAELSGPPGVIGSQSSRESRRLMALFGASDWERHVGNSTDIDFASWDQAGTVSRLLCDVHGLGYQQGFSTMPDLLESAEAQECKASLERTLVEVLCLSSCDAAAAGSPHLTEATQDFQRIKMNF